MKNLIFILSFVSTGIFLIPQVSKACDCGHHSMNKMACCTSQSSHTMRNSSCCNMHDTSHAHSQRDNNSGGNGGCNCSSNNVVNAIAIHEQNSIISQMKERPEIFLPISLLPSGYSSFWQPPKLA